MLWYWVDSNYNEEFDLMLLYEMILILKVTQSKVQIHQKLDKPDNVYNTDLQVDFTPGHWN